MRSRPGLVLALFCLAVSLAAFAPGLGGEFLNFDDPYHVTENPAFHAGFPAGLWQILDPTQTIADVYLPVSFSSLWLDWLVFGPDSPWGFHLQSLLWHAATGWLLALLAADLGLSRRLSALVAGLFLVHPVLCESVVWISGRKDVVSGCLALAALLAGRRCARGEGSWLPVAGLALLACYAKGTAIVLPLLAVPLWRLAQPRPIDERRYWRALALTGLMCAVAAVHHAFLAARQGATGFEGQPTTVPGALLHYLALAAWPLDLAVHYPRRVMLAAFATGAGVKLLYLATLVAGSLVLARRGRMPAKLFGGGVLLALLALLPFNTWYPSVAIAAADRYLYLALPWLATGLVAIAGQVRVAGRQPLLLLIAAAALALLPVTWRRCHDFTRSDRLWTANLARFPHDAVALTNLADWHRRAAEGGGAAAAVPLLEAAVAHADEPVHALRARVTLAVCAGQRGDLAGSADHLRRGVEIVDRLGDDAVARQRRIEMRLDLAETLVEAADHQAAGTVVGEVLGLDASQPEALGLAARDALRRAAAAAKQLPVPASADLAAAEQMLERAAAVPGGGDSVHVLIGRSELARLRGRSTEALRLAATAQRLHPGRGEPYLQAAAIYRSEGVLEGAARELANGITLRPDLAALQVALAEVMLAQGQIADAEALLRRLRFVQPALVAARSALARVLATRARQMVGLAKVQDLAPLVAEAKDLDASAPDLLWLEALVLQAERRTAAALVAIREAAVRQPDEPRVRELLTSIIRDAGYAALLAGDKATACRHFREFLDLEPPRHEIVAVLEIMKSEFEDRFRRAMEAVAASDYATAERGLRQALELFPDHDDALLRLGMVEFATGRHAVAEKTLGSSMQNAERRGADPGLALLYRMKALVELGRGREALEVADLYLRAGDERLRDVALRERVQELATRLRD